MSQPAAFFIEGIRKGDFSVLSRAITLVESQKEEHRKTAQEIIDGLIKNTGNSFRLGVTGVPGVGKSTFIESFGQEVLRGGYRLAVLAVDPSSSLSRGSILGDKTRMETLSANQNVYIRPSPAGGNLGGVTRATYETILLCEAAGFNFVIVETVGVGQSEIAVSRITDFFLLLMLAGAGDELQGIKRGIMEMADAVVITKADGDNAVKARAARAEFAQAMHLLQSPVNGWSPPSMTCSAQTGEGIQDVFKMIGKYRSLVTSNGYFQERRKRQQLEILREALHNRVIRKFYSEHDIEKDLTALMQKDVINPFKEAERLAGAGT
jgi:LAO/AO transport system kinase